MPSTMAASRRTLTCFIIPCAWCAWNAVMSFTLMALPLGRSRAPAYSSGPLPPRYRAKGSRAYWWLTTNTFFPASVSGFTRSS